uniref:ATP-dependent DNA helicase n=1 Tax=Lactuca sativa TaxID=4236 RepID=A0A9R1WLN2_LACSA|nr:hypothetical protein LSAT_V11C900483170 [Lactuca sativa]
MARDRFGSNLAERVRLKLIGTIEKDGRQYNLSTTSEVAALIISDIDGFDSRDIFLEIKSQHLQHINEFHPQYLLLQYPLLFPYDEHGFRLDILHRGVEEPDSKGRIKLTMREFFSYRIQQRANEISLILCSRKPFQHFLVDSYTMVENDRLNYIRFNQPTLRVVLYGNLAEATQEGIEDASMMRKLEVELLNKSRLIIWDEAPVMHRHCFEAADRTLRDIILSLDKNKPFRGKTIVGCPNNDFEETKSFDKWILKIGRGTISDPHDGEVEVEFPENVIVPSTGDHIHSISSDSLCETEAPNSFEELIYSPNVLNGFKASEIPNHKLILKKVFQLCYFVRSTKPNDYAMVLDYRS